MEQCRYRNDRGAINGAEPRKNLGIESKRVVDCGPLCSTHTVAKSAANNTPPNKQIPGSSGFYVAEIIGFPI